MIVDRHLLIVMQLCYLLGNKDEDEAQKFGISKDWLCFESKNLKITRNGKILAKSLLNQNGTRSSYNSF